MRNPTHNFPPVLTGSGEYARPCWPAARGWWSWETFFTVALGFLVIALVAGVFSK